MCCVCGEKCVILRYRQVNASSYNPDTSQRCETKLSEPCTSDRCEIARGQSEQRMRERTPRRTASGDQDEV